jgi:hypothetical protein
MPRYHLCEHEAHRGMNRRYLTRYMYCQTWQLTNEELSEVLRDFDIMSLDMPPRIICKRCARRERDRLR